jgi:hypothetical protein
MTSPCLEIPYSQAGGSLRTQYRPSPPPEDDLIPAGFGIEFGLRLEEAWADHKDRYVGRLARYGRFGMTEDEARFPTPEYMRSAYDQLVRDELADVHTPSPSPSPPPSTTTTPDPLECRLSQESLQHIKKHRAAARRLGGKGPRKGCHHGSITTTQPVSHPVRQRILPAKSKSKSKYMHDSCSRNSTKSAKLESSSINRRRVKSLQETNTNLSALSTHHMQTRSKTLGGEARNI